MVTDDREIYSYSRFDVLDVICDHLMRGLGGECDPEKSTIRQMKGGFLLKIHWDELPPEEVKKRTCDHEWDYKAHPGGGRYCHKCHTWERPIAKEHECNG